MGKVKSMKIMYIRVHTYMDLLGIQYFHLRQTVTPCWMTGLSGGVK